MTTAPHEFEQDLQKLVKGKQIVAIVGLGVSIAATQGKAPTWSGLIEHAAKKCVSLGASNEWFDVVAGQLKLKGHLRLMLSAAELVHSELENFGKGEFARWLRETLSKLEATDTRLIKAIAALNAPIVTTNYDNLIEDVTSLKAITWQQRSEVSRTLHGAANHVVHLHGHWDQPTSVILGIRSYEAVCKDNHTQAVLKALAMTKSFLFIGCGDDGLSDPDFGDFLTWLRDLEKDANVEHRHYRLILRSEAGTVKQQGRIFPLVYGDEHSELPDFLERLNPGGTGTSSKSKPAKKSVAKTAAKAAVVPATGEASPKSASNRASQKTVTRTAAVEAYLTRLTEQTSRLMLLGFGRSLQIELPIAEAFVPLQATLSRSMEPKPKERVQDIVAETTMEVELVDMFMHAARLRLRGVVLLGEPGAGKTTGARQLAWQLASGSKTPEDFGLPKGMTPVLLKFRTLSRNALNQQNGLRTFLAEQTYCKGAKDGLSAPENDLWNGGPLLWILDGLDEVIDPEARKTVARWIQEAIQDRTDDYFLVTCRFAGYFREGVILGPRFAEFHVRRLSDSQVAEFVRRWYQAAYPLLRLSPQLADERATGLLNRLALPEYQAGRMPELRTNPQLLTLLCIVFHDKQQLPDNRAELYAECIMLFLQHWRQEVYDSELTKKRPGFDARAAQSVLAHLAYWMHTEQDRTSAAIGDLAIEATQALQGLQPEAGLGYDGMDFINRMKDETGILASDTEGRCGFLHLSFQEYLAADHAVSQRNATGLAARMLEPWWREVCLLSLRQNEVFCEEFFTEMLQRGAAEKSPDMADLCLRESLYFRQKPFVEVLQSKEPAGRVAAVLRMLRSRTRQVSGLAELVLPLAKSPNESVSLLAGEILAQLGVIVEAPKMHGSVMHHSPGNITLIRIQPGEFQMGSNKRDSDERPIHPVRITKEFLLGRYAVTNAQYAEYLKAVKRKPEYGDDRRFNQPEQPVVGVSWDDAQKFCEWAGCRLPTEAEWEFACRSGTTTAFSFSGDEGQLDKYGWYDKNSGGQTQPVGTKEPNAWGLHDMHGNVFEWCQDWYGEYTQTPKVDAVGPESGQGRVLRGGSWNYPADYCRSSFRYGVLPALRLGNFGFRVARTL